MQNPAKKRPNEGLEHFIGIDLGQVTQTSGLALVETTDAGAKCAVRQMRRYPAGTTYSDIVTGVGNLLSRPPIARNEPEKQYRPAPNLLVGVTAVGQTIGKLFADEDARVRYATITAGDSESRKGRHVRVPKRELIGALQAALQGRRLSIASDLPDAAALLEDLQGYAVQVRLGDEGDDWRRKNSRADDLVLAVALAYWSATAHRLMPFYVAAGDDLD